MKIPNYDTNTNPTAKRRLNNFGLDEDFRMLIAGQSGCQKTNALMHLLRTPLVFYHIFSPNLHQDKLKLAWCHKTSFKHVKCLDHAIEFSGIFLVFVGTVTGDITLNPIVLGVLNGLGLTISSIGKMKNYKRKAEMAKIAHLTYEKILVELRSALRGNEFDENEFLDKMKVVDEMIIDQTPLTDTYEKKYLKKFEAKPQNE